MAHWDNLQTREVQAQQDAKWDEGFVAGIEAAALPLPGWYDDKPASNWSPFQRGYYVGREARVRGILGQVN